MSDSAQLKLLLTGVPGCGKTTVLTRLAELLSDKRLAGFFTEEILNSDQRTGFQAKTFRGEEALLSSIHHKSWVSVGRYGVDVRSFETLVLPELEMDPTTVDLFLIDEIGKMECVCPGFVESVQRVLELNVPLIATVSQQGKGFVRDIKNRPDVQIITVTADNREGLPQKLLDRVTL